MAELAGKDAGPAEPTLKPLEQVGRDAAARIAALDALRGGAMLLGICLHGSISYMRSGMPGLVWGIHEQHTSALFDCAFWCVHAFRLPLFFFIAGFFAVPLYDGRGLAGFLVHRAKRLVVPFCVGGLILLPASFYVSAGGWLVSGRCTLADIRAIKFVPEIQRELFGPAHLWFLEDLVILSVLFGVARWAARCRPGPGVSGREITSPLGGLWSCLARPLWLAAPTALILWADLTPALAHHNSFVPDPRRLLYYGIYFAIGAALYRRRNTLAAPGLVSAVHLVLALAAASAMLLFLRQHVAGERTMCARLALAGSMALLAWLSIFGLLGLCLRCFTAERPALRYLADASYWLYLCHLPLVALLQLDLYELALAPELKFLIVVGLTAALGLASYHTLIRYTFVGAWLHGARTKFGRRPEERVASLLRRPAA